MLLFNSLSCPQLLDFIFCFLLYFCRSGLRDALVVSWDRFDRRCTCDGFYFCFCFILFFLLFCVADCCAERISGVFLVFFEVTATLFINHRSVTQGKKIILQCIFVTGIYLLVICMIVFFVSLLLSCGGISDSKKRSELSLPLLWCYKEKLLYWYVILTKGL